MMIAGVASAQTRIDVSNLDNDWVRSSYPIRERQEDLCHRGCVGRCMPTEYNTHITIGFQLADGLRCSFREWEKSMNWSLFAGFLAITLVLILTPGPVVTLVISTSATNGVRAGLITVAGTSSGTGILLVAIALGLNWVLSHALYLFELLRWTGAAYLIWLGIQAWRHAGQQRSVSTGHHVQFFRGFLVALSNPKTIAFFTAFLPQFVDPTLPAARQLVIMCVISVLLAVVSDSCWAIAAGMGRTWFMKPARAKFLG
jgi:threonine/homoserine/homoserine lactone efflux protein